MATLALFSKADIRVGLSLNQPPHNTPFTLVGQSLSMPQIPCFCDFAQCGGAAVDSQMFDRHKRHDASKRARDTVAAATAACQSQDSAITAHLTSLSLSSNHSSTPSLRCTTINSNIRFSGKSTGQKRVDESLYQLRDIEASLDDFIASVSGQLDRIGYPKFANDVFPLESSISTARTIQIQLSDISSRSVSVQEVRSPLLVRLGDAFTRLEAAKRSWSRRAKVLPAPSNISSQTKFSSGKPWFGIVLTSI